MSLTARALAARAGVRPGYIASLCKSGKIPAERMGDGERCIWLISEDEADRWIDERRSRRAPEGWTIIRRDIVYSGHRGDLLQQDDQYGLYDGRSVRDVPAEDVPRILSENPARRFTIEDLARMGHTSTARIAAVIEQESIDGTEGDDGTVYIDEAGADRIMDSVRPRLHSQPTGWLTLAEDIREPETHQLCDLMMDSRGRWALYDGRIKHIIPAAEAKKILHDHNEKS